MRIETDTTGLPPIAEPPLQPVADRGFASRLKDLAAGIGGLDDFRSIAESYGTLRANLAPVEAEVLDAIIRGQLNKQIATQQGVSVRTVEERRRRAYLGMGVGSSALLAFAAGVAATVEALGSDFFESSPASPTKRSAFSIDTISKSFRVLQSDAAVAPPQASQG